MQVSLNFSALLATACTDWCQTSAIPACPQSLLLLLWHHALCMLAKVFSLLSCKHMLCSSRLSSCRAVQFVVLLMWAGLTVAMIFLWIEFSLKIKDVCLVVLPPTLQTCSL